MEKAESILNKILPQIAADLNYVNYKIQIDPISSGGANYTSLLYNITIEEGPNAHHLFVKVAAIGDKMRNENPKLYTTEMFVYTKLMKIYEALENEYNIPQEHRLILSKFYGCNPTEYEETIVLENLVKKDYQSFNRFNSITWEYAASAIRELVKLHALSFAYSEYYPEEFDKVCRDLKNEFNMENGLMVTADIAMTAKALELVHEEKREMLKKFFDKFGLKEMLKAFQSFRKPVLVHGDYRPSNLMHRNHDDGKIEIKVLDLQTMQATSPMIDLMYFIFTGSDGQFRAQYFEKLLDLYHTELEDALKRFHLVPEKVYSRADFDHDLKEKLPLGLKLAAFILPVLTVSEEDAPKVNDDLDISSFCVKNTSDRCAQLLNEVVDDYIKWGILQ
ncbi:unnamed protein product [Arctia plantaginis]|uniref:CHK kinase-like domain-containing protein n=1 Tax=Arctia plantaginis TaxID=874455 RepID=A0A8S1AGE3_ARCPL|nr:unnamed protein product [Arctia plantaginis]